MKVRLLMLRVLNWYHWILVVTISLLIIALFIIQIILYILHQKRKLAGKIIDELEAVKLLPLKQRLYRLSEIAIYNDDFLQALPYWTHDYEQRSNDLLELMREHQELIENIAKDNFFSNYKKQKKLLLKTQKLDESSRKLLTSYQKVIQMELTQREQATLYKSAFNSLVNDVTKLQMNGQFNTKQLDFLISTIQSLMYNFEIQLTKGAFLKSYQLLDKISLGLITFTHILEKLPQLLTIIHKVIPQQLEQMKEIYLSNQDIKIKDQFLVLSDEIKTLSSTAQKLIDSLQYKKAQQIVEKMLTKLTEFNYKIKKQKDFYDIFTIYYELVIKVVQKIEQYFKNLKKECQQLENSHAFSEMEKETIKTTEQLILELGLQTNSLVVLVNKSKSDLTYHILVKMQYQLLEDALKAHFSLEQLHKLIMKKNEEEKQLQQLLEHLGILLMQLNTKLNQITYHKIATTFKEQIKDVYQVFLELKELISISEDVQEQKRLLHKLYQLKDTVYKLHSKIKNIVIIDQLIQKAIVYGYKFCSIDANVNNTIKSAQLVYESANYEDALQLVLQALEYSNTNRLYRKIGK